MILPRDVCYYDDGNNYCRRTAWDDWVRWVVLVVVVIAFFLLFVACSCVSARRRRRAGQQPFYGTGWAANKPQYGNAQPYYAANPNTYQPPAPPYSPPQNGAPHSGPYYGGNQGYYGQQNGVELNHQQPMSPPPAAYTRNAPENVYEPPPGPPPGKV